MSSKRGRKCSIRSCDNFQHTHKHLSFFRYPKDVARCRLWIERTKRYDLLEKINVHDERICQQHFEPMMFLNESQSRLQQHAVPTLHLTTKPPPMQVPSIIPSDAHVFNNAKFNRDMVDAAAALLYQNNLTITPVYSSKPKHNLNESMPEPLNLSSATSAVISPFHNGQNSDRNSIVLNSSDSSTGSLNHSINDQSSSVQQMQPTSTISMQPTSTIATPSVTPMSTNGIKPIPIIPNSSGSRRPRQVFTFEQENELADFVRETSNYYSGLSSKEVRILAFVYGVCNQVDMPVGWRETHQASFDWCVGFIKRTKLPPTMVTSISSKSSNKQSKSSNSNINSISKDNKTTKSTQLVNGNGTQNANINDEVIPIEID